MPKLSVSAWLAPDDAAALASLKDHAGLLSRLYPQWYWCGPEGMPLRRTDAGPEARQKVLKLARGGGLELWPHLCVQPLAGPGPEPQGDRGVGLQRILFDAASRRAHAAEVLRLVREDGVQGVDLDYGRLPDAAREPFKALVSEICSLFHAAGLKVGVVAQARTGQLGARSALEAGDDAPLAWASVCDALQIMARYPGLGQAGPARPGPLAPPDWCWEVLGRVGLLAPVERIEWALPGGGGDWGPDGAAKGLPWDAWAALARAHPPERRDARTAELTLAYEGREAWTNDAISLTAKLWKLRLHGVTQVALWGLGAEDPRVWALVDSLPGDFLGTEQQ
ncbi:MAG TPA: hypothetical protein VK914_06885 [bacterium]|jgi:spore germination protein YaaH|nr:hypothetical protein [bacterium]